MPALSAVPRWAFIVALAGCETTPPRSSNDAGVDLAPTDLARPSRDQVDVLFVFANEGSTSALNQAVRTRFPDFLNALDAFAGSGHAASYHFGVITPDLGAPGIKCGRGGGDHLQALGRGSSLGCLGPSFSNFLVYDQLHHTDNAPAAQTVAWTFGCMANGGDKGCGFQMPLESAYRALHDPIVDNSGFLREEALLVVIFVADEEDCSADPDSDLFTLDTSVYGALSHNRCSFYGIWCDGALVPQVASVSYTSCRPATRAEGSKLVDVDRYIDLFTKPRFQGGIKRDPRDVIVAGVTGPSTPYATRLNLGTELCGRDTQSCVGIDHSCFATPGFFADPAVRINTVIETVPNHYLLPTCTPDYLPMLEAVAAMIGQGLGATP